MAVAADIPTSMTVSYRCANSVPGKASEGTPERTEPWTLVGLDSVMSASPWRTFRWHRGQRHYSGSFWSATERDLVIYESRLELARLLFADFDRSVQRILAQPFLLRAEVAGVLRKHVPDYLLLTSTGPLVVDVKPHHRATKPDTMFVFGWTRQLLESRGWRYEVWSEPPHAELENVRFWPGIGGTGCSITSFSPNSVLRISTAPRWQRRASHSQINRGCWCDPQSCICCGSSTSRPT